MRRVHNIFEDIRAQPRAVVDGSNYGIIEYGALLFVSLYSPFGALPPFTSALAALEAGDGVPMLTLIGGKRSLPNCDTPPTDPPPTPEAGAAVMCGEGLGVGRSLNDIVQHIEELSELSALLMFGLALPGCPACMFRFCHFLH